MATVYSNLLKAVLFPNNMEENGINVIKSHCFTVQHYSYECERSRNDAGFPFGGTHPTILQVTLRLLHPADSKLFYQRMFTNVPFPYSMLFNATFSEQNRLNGFDDAMVAEGYLIDVDEDYDNTPAEDGSESQLLITVKLLLSAITYRGRNINRQLVISKR